jgi:aspartate-semialdehyde dehydrogenase
MLWQGIAAYAAHNRKRLLFGCASLPGTLAPAAASLTRALHARGHVDAALAVRPRPGFEVPMRPDAAPAGLEATRRLRASRRVRPCPMFAAVHDSPRGASVGGLTVAVAGATGAVGAEFLRLLEKRSYPIGRLKLLASRRSVGRTLRFAGQEIPVEELTADAFEGVDHAFFSAGATQSRAFAPAAAAAGAVVIDNSSAFRYEDEIPLVVPEINPEDAFRHHGIIANPNCTTIVALVAVAPLHRAFGLRRAVLSSYQAISGAGAQAMAELERQVHDWVAGRPLQIEHQPKQIAFNVIPRIDAVQDNFYTKEEMKFVWEGRKILHHPTLLATATCVRVPVFRSHAVSLNLEFERPASRDEALAVLHRAPGIRVTDDPAAEVYPTPLETTECDEVFVGRVRGDISVPDGRGLALWAVGDQLAKGAALNAVQIGELLLRRA